MVENEKVIAVVVKAVHIALSAGHFRQRPRAEPFIEYAIAQRLRGIDVGRCFRQPHLQQAATEYRRSRPVRARRGRPSSDE